MEVTDVDGVPTHVFTLAAPAGNDSLLFIVPGSPGMGHFYVPFATRLFQLGGGAYDVSVVSHAGHSPGVYKHPASQGSEEGASARDWFSLEDQISHKLAFLQERAREKRTLYLVGHSIGCYIILKMLKQLAPSRVGKIFFLFPTIEKMAATPNGVSLRPLFTTYRSTFTGTVWLLGSIPEFIKFRVLRQWFSSSPPEHVDYMCRAVMNIDSCSIYNILSMAEQEVKEVDDLPVDTIGEVIDKTVFYYGVGDKWNCEKMYEEMAERFPGKDINVCKCGYSHSFVIDSSLPMADYVFNRLPKDE